MVEGELYMIFSEYTFHFTLDQKIKGYILLCCPKPQKSISHRINTITESCNITVRP